MQCKYVMKYITCVILRARNIYVMILKYNSYYFETLLYCLVLHL